MVIRRKAQLEPHGASGMVEWWFALIAPGKGALSFQVVSGKPCLECDAHWLLAPLKTFPLSGAITRKPVGVFLGLHRYFKTSVNERRRDDCSLCPGGRCFRGEMALSEGSLFWETHGVPEAKIDQPEEFWKALENLFIEMLAEAEEKRTR